MVSRCYLRVCIISQASYDNSVRCCTHARILGWFRETVEPTAACPGARPKRPSNRPSLSFTGSRAPAPTATHPGARAQRPVTGPRIPRAAKLSRPPQHLQMPAWGDACTCPCITRTAVLPRPLPRIQVPFRSSVARALVSPSSHGWAPSPARPTGTRSTTPAARRTCITTSAGAAPALLRASAGDSRPAPPPATAAPLARAWFGRQVQPLEYLLLEEVEQAQLELRARLPLSHERPPSRDDAPREGHIRGRCRREGASRSRRGVSILRLLAPSLLEHRCEVRRPLQERRVQRRVIASTEGGRRQLPAP
jgi:hypothetical protein